MRAFLRLGTVLALVACGGATPVVQPTPPLPLPPPAVSVAPNVDLAPVAAPANLVAVGRLNRPSKIPGVISAWTGMPIPIDEALDEVVGDAVAKVVDMAQPIDVAVVLEGKRFRPQFAVSVGVRSIDDAKSALASTFNFSPLANGAFKLEAQKHKPKPCRDDNDECDDDDGPRFTRPCVLAPAYGSATARIVCGKTPVDSLWPYMVRGVTRIETTSDIHLELRADGLRGALGDKTPFGMLARDLSGNAGSRLLAHLNTFGTDVDKIVIDGKLDDAGASATAALTFREVRSPISKMFMAHADKAGPPPAAFSKLPSESDMAFYESGIETTELEESKSLAADALDESMQKDGVAAPDRKAVTDALRSTMTVMGAPLVFAKGTDIAGAQAAVDAAKQAKAAALPAAEKTLVEKMGGWNIIGVELPVAKVSAVAKEWSAVASRAAIIKLTTRSNQPAMTIKQGAVGKGLAQGSEHWEIAVPVNDWSKVTTGANGQQSKPPVLIRKLHVVLVPDGGTRTWMVWSLDEGAANDKGKVLLAPSGSTLGARSGLDDLKAARSNAGGFVTMRAIATDWPVTALDRSASTYLNRPDPLYGLSTSTIGQTAVPFWIGAGSNQTMTVGVSFTRPVVKDVIGLSRALRW